MGHRPAATPGVFIGLLAIAAGVILLLDRQGLVNAGYLFQFFWPGVFLVAGIARLIQPCDGPGRIWGALLTAAGILLLLDRLGYVHFSFRDIWPLLLIGFGLMFLSRALARNLTPPLPRSPNVIKAWTIFGGGEITNDSQDFQGGEVFALFGGYSIDLRRAVIKAPEAVLHATATFGGIDIRVPETWSVSVEGSPFLGGYGDKTHKPDPGEGPVQRLVIKGSMMFGGIDVKN